MHMADGRLLTFARKPAPVQITWLAYPGGTGLDAMDYRLTDSYLDPPELGDLHYTEKSIRLPDCWVCYDPLSDLPERENSSPRPCHNPSQFCAESSRTLLPLWLPCL